MAIYFGMLKTGALTTDKRFKNKDRGIYAAFSLKKLLPWLQLSAFNPIIIFF
jgi:hypothetical protein